MNNHGYLFCNYDLNQILEKSKQSIQEKIQSESNEYIANVNQDDYLSYIQASFNIECPILNEEKISIEKKEAKIEKYNRYFSKTGYVDGIIIKVTIPFTGDPDLFLARANTFSSRHPIGDVSNHQVTLSFPLAIYELEETDINQIIQDEINIIKKYLSFVEKDLNAFNSSIKIIAKAAIDYKIDKYNKINSFVKGIKYELKTNEHIPETYKIPNVVRKIEIIKPESKKLIPEPVLEDEEYNHILKICSDMSLVMERSPKSFAQMDEEALRTHFLVQLNGHYQGQATGETFNSNGKTDILIRNDNQNVFIAECKFWKGKKGYLSTIDQLLGYVTYRDTKTAVFMFVRNKNFTEVFQQMKEVVTEHSNFVRFVDSYVPPKGSSAFRCEFKNQNDEEKHFYITFMAFCIPDGD